MSYVICQRTGKRGFASKRQARSAGKTAKKLRPYFCNECHRWHLTSTWRQW